MLFLGNLLFAGVLGKSTENASLAALIQKNIAERVDPSFRALKAEHVGISPRDLTARHLMKVEADKILVPDFKLKIVKIIESLIKKDQIVRWTWMFALFFCPINYIFVILWQSLTFFPETQDKLSFISFLGYDFTAVVMIVLMISGIFYEKAGTIVLNYWLQWGVFVFFWGALGNALGEYLPGFFYDDRNPKAKAEALITLGFILPVAATYVVLIVFPLLSTVKKYI